MSLHEILLISVLVASIAMEAYACVCYVGQEPNSVKGEPPLKLLPDQNPCECTEFRPGGVNTKQQAKPYEVTFGNNGHPEGWTEMDCIHVTKPSYTTSPCVAESLKAEHLLYIPPDQKQFKSYPVRLEFTLQSSTNDLVLIHAYNVDTVICTVELDGGSHQMSIKIDDAKQTEDFQDAFDGSTHYWVTINQHKFQFGRLGETSSSEYQSDIMSKITRMAIWTKSDTTVAFFGTCPENV